MSEQPDYSGSAMIALYPPLEVAKALALPAGLAPADIHLTVADVGDAATVDRQALLAAAREINCPRFTATISGAGRFSGDDKDVLVALADSPHLEDLRHATLTALASHSIPAPREHGYCPHLTRAYIAPTDTTPAERLAPIPVLFTTLSVVHGTNRTDLPLGDGAGDAFEQAVRRAYALGWARTGGPLSDRVRAGLLATVRTASEHPEDPHVLEVSLKLGQLEGTWAQVYERREALIAHHAQRATEAWNRILTRDQIASAVRDFQQRAGIAEADPDATDRQRQLKAAAVAAAAAMLQALPTRPGWQTLRTAVRNAIAAGQAEGMVAAVAIAAERADRVGLNWDVAYEDAYAALANLGMIWAQVDGWLARMIDRAVADLGRALAAAAQEQASSEQMLASASDVLSGDDVNAVTFVVDWAATTALGSGALNLYTSQGVRLVDWLTAGDENVCPACDSNEENGPYAPEDFPAIPQHPLCRCTPAPSGDDVPDLSGYDGWFAAA